MKAESGNRRNPVRIALGQLVRRRRLAVVAAGLLGLLTAVSLSAIQIPTPRVHDEFSYLLAADTYAHGRLTNETHPMWRFFQGPHVLHVPTYASKYPPAQGMVLALGQVAGGHPVVGLWLGFAFAVAACCWMLQGWHPARWALLGAVLVALHSPILLRWAHGYWGGAVAMAGAAMVWGALPRIRRHADTRSAIVMGVGLAILANSRPYEGLVVSLPVAIATAVWLIRQDRYPRFVVVRRVVVPVLCVLGIAASAMLYLNWRVTGDPWTLPHQLYQEQYLDSKPHFVWQRSEPESAADREPERTIGSRIGDFAKPGRFFFDESVLATFGIPLLALPWLVRLPRMRFALATVILGVVASSLTSYTLHPHYFAPVFPVYLLIVVGGLRVIRLSPRNRPGIGRNVVRVLVLLQVWGFAVTFADSSQRWPKATADRHWHLFREEVVRRLEDSGEKHLILVRYGPDHHPWIEWVYNEADIDGAAVVWADERIRGDARPDPDRIRELLAYFEDREAWLLVADERPWRLGPYPE